MKWPAGARTRKRKSPEGTQLFQGWPHGINTSVPSPQIAATELAECLNFKINPGGQLETRRPIGKYITGATDGNSAVKAHLKVNIDFLTYEVVADANHKVYYIEDNSYINVGTAIGDVQLINYNGTCIVLDGSYVKYLPLAAGASLVEVGSPLMQIGDFIAVMGVDSAAMKIAYDDGSGATGCQFDNSSGDDDGSINLGDGTNNRVATKFTSQSWDTGFTIPLTSVSAKLSKTGSPAGNIVCKLRLVSDDSVLATKTFKDIADVTGTATAYSVSFTEDDITTEMSNSIDYYATLEYSGGDGSNYVNVHYSDGDGTGYIYTASWAQATAKDPIMRLNPGRPPKGKFGDVYKHRLFIGGDEDNPGKLYFSNLTYLDWSTSDGGGWVGAVDDNANSFAVGGIINQFGALMIYGTETQPYLARLEGDSPSEYQVPVLMQKSWTLSKTLVSTVNDVWNGSGTGVDTLTGVQYYGDVRTRSASDPIRDKINDYWSSEAFAGYNPLDGQFWLVMPNYHRVLVANTKTLVKDPSGATVRHPWFEYEFYRDDFSNTDNYQWVANGNEYYLQAAAGGTPSLDASPDHITINGGRCVKGTAGSLNEYEWDYALDPTSTYYTVYIKDGNGNPSETDISIKSILLPTSLTAHDSKFFIGASDGYIYTSSSSSIKDLSTVDIDYKIKTSFIQAPFSNINLTKQQVFALARGGAYATLRLHKNNLEREYVHDYTYSFALSDTMTVDEAEMSVDDAVFLVDRDDFSPWLPMNVDCNAFQAELRDITPVAGYPFFVNGIIFKYRQLEK